MQEFSESRIILWAIVGVVFCNRPTLVLRDFPFLWIATYRLASEDGQLHMRSIITFWRRNNFF